MADISSYLQQILEAIYGEEVRGSIHDALAAMNVESNKAMELAATAKDSAQASAVLAEQSATTAVTKAGEIVDSANAAKTSETNARAAEANAVQKAADAAASANAAKISEGNAASSEAVARQKASEAEASKNAAALSETNTLAAEQRTKTIKAEVELLGAQATSDKNAAEAARDAAKASQTAAALSESNAATHEKNTGLSKDAAEAAQLAAEQARDDAQLAQKASEDARDAAKASQDASALSETNAATSAETAKKYSGNPPKPIDGTWWIWNADAAVYEDTGIACDLVGPTGNGIESITLTNGDHMPGTTDVYTIKMTDGSTKEISVYNGQNGTGIGDVVGIAFDIEIPVAGWVDGKITIADSRFIASARYKYFIDAYDNSRDEVKDSVIKPMDITANGYITFTSEYDPTTPVTVNIMRVEVNGSGDTP